MKFEFTIPMSKDLFVSEANKSNQHWTKKKKRHDTQKFLINAYFSKSVEQIVSLPCVVSLTRVAPRELDFVNLISSFKWIQDYVADKIIPGLAPGRADGDKRIHWRFLQEKGHPKHYALKVEIVSNVKWVEMLNGGYFVEVKEQ